MSVKITPEIYRDEDGHLCAMQRIPGRAALAAKLEEVTAERDEAIADAKVHCADALRAIERAEQAERERDARPALTADEWRVVVRALRAFRSDYETSEPDEDIETASRIINKLAKEKS